MNNIPLPALLRRARLDACMTATEVYKRTGISQPQLIRLERHQNRNITFATVARLCRVYKVSLDEIAERLPDYYYQTRKDRGRKRRDVSSA